MGNKVTVHPWPEDKGGCTRDKMDQKYFLKLCNLKTVHLNRYALKMHANAEDPKSRI